MRTLLLIFTLSTVSIHAAQLAYEKNLSADLAVVDAKGNAYVAGSGTITRLNPDGSISYSKTLALTGMWTALAVDANGNLILAGTTADDNLPTTSSVLQPKRNSAGTCLTTGGQNSPAVPCQDAFVAKLDPAGNLLWVTYLGGSSTEQADGVAVDSSGNIMVVGVTSSATFPLVGSQSRLAGGTDGFVAKISPDGTKLLYSTFVGGAGNDIIHAVAVDAAGNAYIAGEGSVTPTSGNFGQDCTTSGTHAFLEKISVTGSVAYAGCLGSASTTSAATAVAVDAAGDVYVGGTTTATDFPLTSGAYDGRKGATNSDFIVKISPDGSKLLSASLLDGATAGIYSLAVDSTGAVYAAGATTSSNLTSTGPALQPCPGPGDAAYNFVLKLNAAGSGLTYLSYEDASQTTISLGLGPDGSVVEAAGLVRRFTNLDTATGSYLSPFCVLNGGNLSSHVALGQPGISPGELVTLEGTGLGPATGASYNSSSNVVPTTLGGTQVLFDGVAAPLVYAQDRQINVIAPSSLAGKKQTSIQVVYQGVTTAAVVIPVSQLSLTALTNPQTGAPLVANQDTSLNSASNPAAPGTVLVLYVTGGGATSPAGIDGQVSQTPLTLEANVTGVLQNFINGSPVTLPISLISATSAPGRPAVQIIKVQIPSDLPSYFLSGNGAGATKLIVTVGTQGLSVPVVIR